MALTNEQNYNINGGYGKMLANAVASMVPTFGRILVVTGATTDNNYPRLSNMFVPHDGRIHLYSGTDGLVSAMGEAETNSNDVICLDGQSTHSLSDGLALTKNRLNFIGMDGGDRLQAQGARVQLATAATTAYVVRNTGTRNSFRNIKFIQAATAATGLHVLEEGGEGSLYKNCSSIFGVVDNLDLTTANEVIMGSDTGTYLDCTFGAATLTTTASGGRTVLLYDAVTGGATTPRDNVFKNCIFTIESSDAGSQFVSMAASGDAKGINLFDNCSFIASLVSGGGIALTKAVSTANGLTDGIFCYAYPRAFNVANFGTNGTNNDNLYVIGSVVDPSAATDFIAVKPVAT
jgi:hypothetical protein